jgi:hypothetical protein
MQCPATPRTGVGGEKVLATAERLFTEVATIKIATAAKLSTPHGIKASISRWNHDSVEVSTIEEAVVAIRRQRRDKEQISTRFVSTCFLDEKFGND